MLTCQLGTCLSVLLDQNLMFCGSVENFHQFPLKHVRQCESSFCCKIYQNKPFFLNYHEYELFSVCLSVQLLTAQLCFPGRANRVHLTLWPFHKDSFENAEF